MMHAFRRFMHLQTAEPCIKSRHNEALTAVEVTVAASASAVACPYCGGQMRWAPARWLTLGAFDCDRCGEFPDFHGARRAIPARDLVTLQTLQAD